MTCLRRYYSISCMAREGRVRMIQEIILRVLRNLSLVLARKPYGNSNIPNSCKTQFLGSAPSTIRFFIRKLHGCPTYLA